jgi:predicted alpha-1,2-mannosidase
MPGPSLPFASVYPSPNTLNGKNGGYSFSQKITGFAQLHAQGTGGMKSYGNFLIAPQIGLKFKEEDRQSFKEEEHTSAYYYNVILKKYGIRCELSPTHNAALYKFTFPATDSAIIYIDAARKNGGDIGLDSGYVKVSADGKSIYGGGSYYNNWPNPEGKWKMYFYAEFSKPASYVGSVAIDRIVTNGREASAQRKSLGAYVGFNFKDKQEVYVKMAVSFISWEHARLLAQKEIPHWNLEAVKESAKNEWNKKLSTIQISGTQEEKIIFYTNLFHSFIQPRNRRGNNSWKTDEDYWDDHYTLWDSWKTLFPLMSIIDQKMVASNISSFINRQKHHGYVATAFVNGNEHRVGQGGNTVDNVIGDAYVRKVKGVDWEKAYSILKYNADSMRTEGYRTIGYMYHEEPHNYSWRTKGGSATIAFAFGDYCAAMVAAGLGKKEDQKKYLLRSGSWKNIWNVNAESMGYKGFIMSRKKDGSFDEIDPKTGYNHHFYEGTCWEYSYEIPHDISGLVSLMGGSAKFTDRLQYAMDQHLIDFGNEPNFMTPWLFANEAVRRPDLTAYYVNTKILPQFTRYDLPGDDDQGAMGSMYVFMKLGFFPIAGTNKFYLHGTSLPKSVIRPTGGKPFSVISQNAGKGNIYIQSVMLNGKKLNRSYITQDEIFAGGLLQFTMTNKPVNFLK